MNTQKINYIVMLLLLITVLIAGYFGIVLPIQPVIPDPLPTATPVILSAIEKRIADLETRADDLELATMGDDAISFGVYQTDCRMESGGNQWTAAEGCVWEVQSGATLDVQSGATLTLTNAAVTTQTVTSLTATDATITTGTVTTATATSLTATDAAITTGTVTTATVTSLTATAATLTNATVTTLTVGGYEFAVSDPLTITGVLTDVRVLYFQVP